MVATTYSLPPPPQRPPLLSPPPPPPPPQLSPQPSSSPPPPSPHEMRDTMNDLLLPDEVWSWILQVGISGSYLSHRDLCSLAICSRRLHRLSSEPSLWSSLLSRDFPSSSTLNPLPTPKSLYKIRFERDKARKLTDWKLDVMNVESQIGLCARNLREFEKTLRKEHMKLKAAADEHVHLQHVRQASVALNVWQPEVVRSSQRKMVSQCSVSIESRVNSLEMEIRLCKQEIALFSNAYKANKKRLQELKQNLELLKYHPMRNANTDKSLRDLTSKRRRIKK